jgi:hypothetical protein
LRRVSRRAWNFFVLDASARDTGEPVLAARVHLLIRTLPVTSGD